MMTYDVNTYNIGSYGQLDATQLILNDNTMALMQNGYGAGAAIGFRTNSVYDPCYPTLTRMDKSFQLYNYMSRFYQRYSVKWCRIEMDVTQINTNCGTNCNIGFGIRLDNDAATSLGTFADCRTDPKWKTAIMTCVGVGGDRPTIRLKHFWSEKMLNANDRSDNGAAPGYNPSGSATYYFMPALCALEGASLTGPQLLVRVRMYAKVEWSDLKDLDCDTLIVD